MVKAYVMIANGTEESECLTVLDILRRGGADVTLVSVEEREVVSSHGVRITSDAVIGEVDLEGADLIYTPGGMPGTTKLAACDKLIQALRGQIKRGKRVAAMCAAPALVLAEHGMLGGVKAVCHGSFAHRMPGAVPVPEKNVVTDGNITTARGMSYAVELGLELLSLLCGSAAADDIRKKIEA